MNIKTPLAVAAITGAVGWASFLGANTVSAQTTGESLVEKFSAQFNLDETEVQAFFDGVKDERQADREANRAEKLQELVDAGTITDEQKTLIEESRANVQAQMEELKPEDKSSLTDDERDALKDQMQTIKDEAQAELEAAGIDLDEIRGDRDGRGHGGRMGGHGERHGGGVDNEEEV